MAVKFQSGRAVPIPDINLKAAASKASSILFRIRDVAKALREAGSPWSEEIRNWANARFQFFNRYDRTGNPEDIRIGFYGNPMNPREMVNQAKNLSARGAGAKTPEMQAKWSVLIGMLEEFASLIEKFNRR